MEEALKKRKYESWNFNRLYCTYLNLKMDNTPNNSELEIITSILVNKPFGERLKFYRNLLRNMHEHAKLDSFEYALELRNRAEDFRAHILD